MAVTEATQELKARDQWVAYTSGKIPIGPNGLAASSNDPATWGTFEQARWVKRVQGLAGLGFMFSADDEYVGIDLDMAVDPSTGELYGWAADVVASLDSYTELSPSGLGVHVWVKGTTPRPGARRAMNDRGGKLEVYSSLRYFTVTGNHLPNTPTTIRERDMVEFWGRWFDDDDRRESEPVAEPATWETPDLALWLGDALAAIPPHDYDVWYKVGMALKSELGDGGLDWWVQWSSYSDKYPGRAACERKWNSFKDVRSSIATVVWLAQEHGWTMPRIERPSLVEHIDWESWLAAEEDVGGAADMDSGLGIRWVSFADAYRDKTPFEPDLIGPGVLGSGDMMLLFGPPKTMKTMALLDACRSWCQGKDWLHFTVQRPLRIAYAQFEVKADQMRKRIQLADLSDDELRALDGNLFFTDRFTPILNADFVKSFAAATLHAFAGELDVLVLDPLANIYTGDNENDNAQMSRFIREIKLLRNAIDPRVAIVLVHHANKTGRDDRRTEPFNALRGAGALRGAYDTGVSLDLMGDEPDAGLLVQVELRNGPRMADFEMEFVDGRFRLIEKAAEAAPPGAGDVGASGTADDARDDWIVEKLRSEAEAGRMYVTNSFADMFGGDAGVGASTLRRNISSMLTRGVLGFFKPGDAPEELPGLAPLSGRSHGYLCCREMHLLSAGVLRTIHPTGRRDPGAGTNVRVEGWW